LSCKNGVVELKTGELRNCVPGDNMTKSLKIEYDISARTEDWDKFVREITSSEEGEDEELYNYIRWAVGYAMQGSPTKKLFFILYGERGYNGKSMFLNMIKNVVEFYAVAMDKSVVVEGPSKSGGSHSTEICQLENSRFGILSETKEDEVINDGQMKMLTGVTDKLSVREIYGKQKEFSPTFVPFISSNHKLKINLKDPAMYERLILIPFRLSFVSEPKESWHRKGDESLAEKFNKNKEGILKWLVECSVYYHQNIDMAPPSIVMKEKMEYRREMDEYADFVERHILETNDPKDVICLSEIMLLYKQYCVDILIKYEFKKSEKIIIDCLTRPGDKKITGRKEKFAGYKFKTAEDDNLF
jgi:putative DNA primase/helicase